MTAKHLLALQPDHSCVADDSVNLRSSWLRAALLAGLLTGFALRLIRLGGESLWYDETVSVYLARLSLGEMIAHTAGDIHPPGYYALLHGWQLLSQPTLEHGLEFLFAWPSLWAGMLLLALLVPVGRRLLNDRAAVLAVWLAAVNPFHLWYSQEVRMYTVGAALGLLCLWAMLRYFDQTDRAWVWLAVYAVAAAAGLYALYYFAFLLLGLNAIALLLILQHPPDKRGQIAGSWLGAQALALLLWLPWLPIFVRQGLNPPVPPWREPWSTGQAFLASLSETLGALLIGQTPPGSRMWPYALLTLMALGAFLWLGARRKQTGRGDPLRSNAVIVLLIYLLAPIAILYLLTAVATPLYHVRYLFLFAPVFMLILAAVIVELAFRRRWLALATLTLTLCLSLWSLAEFWLSPTYRADDHRAAVADLAQTWRPGDVILANAGWIYPALQIYWPSELVGPLATAPPAIGWDGRFIDYAAGLDVDATPTDGDAQVIIARTGSVDGDPELGWGDPASDFFAVSSADTIAALDALGEVHPRIWHYRLYDTVSDPSGVIRTWLDEQAVLAQDFAYPGRDYLRVQRYDFSTPRASEATMIPVNVQFGDALRLYARDPHGPVHAGEYFYVNLHWEALPGLSELDTDLSFSLRLYEGGSDLLLAQTDRAPLLPTSSWQPGARVTQRLAVATPAAAKPLRYAIELVVYRQDTGEPLAPSGEPKNVIDDQRWRIGLTDIFGPLARPEIASRLARFDYIDLTQATPDRGESVPGGEFRAELIWTPQPNDYRDAYDAVIELRNDAGDVAAAWRQVAGGLNYPSSVWPEGYPVREVRVMPLPDGIAPGEYAVTVRLERASDGLQIAAHQKLVRSVDAVEIGDLRIVKP